MKTDGKSPVVILQELIAMLTTRKEASERISEKAENNSLQEELKTRSEQTNSFIAELMEELNQYGDAVMGETNRDNAYQNAWKEILPMLDTAEPGVLAQRFIDMESTLADTYRKLLSNETDLPETLRQKIEKQSKEIDRNATLK